MGIYLLKSTLILLVLYGYYRLFLHRETWLQFNRFFLLGAVVLSMILPFIELPVQTGLTVPPIFQTEPVVIESTSEYTLSEGRAYGWMLIARVIYLSGLFMALGLMLYRFGRLFMFIWQAETENRVQKMKGYTQILTQGKVPTSSFFRYLLWDNTLTLSSGEEAQVRAHEQCHIRQAHSLDLLFMECVLVVFWFHPLLYLVRKDLLRTHEFLADRAAINREDIPAYSQLILKQLLGMNFSLAHTFFESPAKARIQMLKRYPNVRRSFTKYLWLTPVTVGLFLLVGGSSWQSDTVTETLPEDEAIPPAAAILIDEAVPAMNSFIAVDKAPEPLNMRDIQRTIGYPQIARDAGIEGAVIARILVDTDGTYLRHEIINSVHPVLDQTVENQLPNLRFTPALQNGAPLKFWINIPFNFKLIR